MSKVQTKIKTDNSHFEEKVELRIESEADKGPVSLRGDNMKYLPSLNLKIFDIIDLDAYGSPVKQMSVVFRSGFQGIVHCTFIQAYFGGIDTRLLEALGYTENMVKKCPTLLYKNALDKMLSYLYIHDVESIIGYFNARKNYFYFVAK